MKAKTPFYLVVLALIAMVSCKQKEADKTAGIVAYASDFSEAINTQKGYVEIPEDPAQPEGRKIRIACADGYIEVPENHARPEGRKIRIAYVVIKAKDTTVAPGYPMIYFSGGPGGITISAQAVMGFSQAPVNNNRDIILFDQRGINYSTALPDIGPELFNAMQADVNPEQEKAMFAEVLASYKQKCAEEGIDLGSYNSFENARDVGMLMTYLGYEKYNLFGGSYGTRLARVVQDMFPEKIYSVILDSPAPMQTDFLISRLESYTLALQRVFDFCENDPECSAKYPDLKNQYIAAITSLKEAPMEIMLNGTPFYVNAQDALYFLRRRLYRGDSRESAPAFIMALNTRDAEAIKSDINYEKNVMVPFINTSMLLAVENYEQFDAANTPQVIDSIYKTMALFPEKLGFFTALYEAGQGWHDNRLPVAERVFKPSDVPTLVFVNQYDPVTPPEYGHYFKKKLSNSELFIMDQGGHGAIMGDMCSMQVMMDFMDTADKDSLDTSCLKLYTENSP